MNGLLFLCSIGAFVVAALGLWRPAEPLVRKLYAWVPVPALVLAVMSFGRPLPEMSVYSDLLLGTQIGLDPIGRAFLILSAGVWLLAGLYARSYFSVPDQERLFRFYFLVAYSGTIGLILAQDAPTFYAGYALMTIGGYGLVINTRTQAALIAGRVYIVVALVAEMFTLAGIIIAASTSSGFSLTEIAQSIRNSEMGPWAFWLIFLGFGTKVGLVPLHFWLPRSYYWAPLPAVAVLSGAMTKAGVLGWLRFLKDYESNIASTIVIAAGALMAFYGVIFGLLQTRAKTTLAFSSLSQMGYLTLAFATTIEQGAVATKAFAGIAAFSFHHGFTKVCLFLGLGLLANTRARSWKYWLVFGGLTLCALSLVGIPYSSGAYAKNLLKSAGTADGMWMALAPYLTTAGSIGTALLMLRFLVLCLRGENDQVQPSRAWFTWGATLMIVILGAWLLPEFLNLLGLRDGERPPFLKALMTFAPIAVGTALAGLVTFRVWYRQTRLSPRPFDPLLQGQQVLWEEFPRRVNEFIDETGEALVRVRHHLGLEKKSRWAVEFSRGLRMGWFTGCTLFLIIGLVIWLFLARGGP